LGTKLSEKNYFGAINFKIKGYRFARPAQSLPLARRREYQVASPMITQVMIIALRSFSSSS